MTHESSPAPSPPVPATPSRRSRMIDLTYGLLILVLLVLCTALPLAMVQAVTLFNSSFLRFLSQRNRRSRVLNELLDVA